MNAKAPLQTHPAITIGQTLHSDFELLLLLAAEKKESVTSVGSAELRSPKFTVMLRLADGRQWAPVLVSGP